MDVQRLTTGFHGYVICELCYLKDSNLGVVFFFSFSHSCYNRRHLSLLFFMSPEPLNCSFPVEIILSLLSWRENIGFRSRLALWILDEARERKPGRGLSLRESNCCIWRGEKMWLADQGRCHKRGMSKDDFCTLVVQKRPSPAFTLMGITFFPSILCLVGPLYRALWFRNVLLLRGCGLAHRNSAHLASFCPLELSAMMERFYISTAQYTATNHCGCWALKMWSEVKS